MCVLWIGLSRKKEQQGKDSIGITITSIVEKYIRPCVLGHILALFHLTFATIIYYPCFVGEETDSER